MINLIANEYLKLFYRRAFVISVAIFLLLSISASILIKSIDEAFPSSQQDWKQELRLEQEFLKSSLHEADTLSPDRKRELENQLKVIDYQLAHNLNPNAPSLWTGMQNSLFLTGIIEMYMIVIASGIVVREFEWGTIKSLLTRPPGRTKVLASKYLTLLLTAAGLLILLLFVLFLTNLVQYGGEGFGQSNVTVGTDGSIELQSPLLPMFAYCGYRFVEIVVVMTLAFMLSILLRNSSGTIALTFVLSFGSAPLSLFISKYTWLKYYLFANINLQMYADGTQPLPEMTLGFSVTILSLYMLVFLGLSWYVFRKRDIAAK